MNWIIFVISHVEVWFAITELTRAFTWFLKNIRPYSVFWNIVVIIIIIIIIIVFVVANPSGLAFSGFGLRPLVSWDRVFETRRGHGCLSLVSVVCCQVEVSASGWSLLQRTPTECGVSECDREASIMIRAWPARGFCATEKILLMLLLLSLSSSSSSPLSLVHVCLYFLGMFCFSVCVCFIFVL